MAVELEPSPSFSLLEPIECMFLDGENASWAKRYIERCQEKLENLDDLAFASYLRREIATHTELLARFKKG